MIYKVLLVKVDVGPQGHPHVGYAVGCPALPGCWAQGDTEHEALINIQYAISEYLSVRDTLILGDERDVEIPTVPQPVPQRIADWEAGVRKTLRVLPKG
jgi:predicted RNase H-like HicB family nuclease